MDEEKHNNPCGKVMFESFFDAKQVLNKLNNGGRAYGKSARRRTFKKPKQVYLCPDCGYFHLTSKRKK